MATPAPIIDLAPELGTEEVATAALSVDEAVSPLALAAVASPVSDSTAPVMMLVLTAVLDPEAEVAVLDAPEAVEEESSSSLPSLNGTLILSPVFHTEKAVSSMFPHASSGSDLGGYESPQKHFKPPMAKTGFLIARHASRHPPDETRISSRPTSSRPLDDLKQPCEVGYPSLGSAFGCCVGVAAEAAEARGARRRRPAEMMEKCIVASE
ncbi:unnamed protein product [Clonostachys chloroleuca]|uniref:Uncharacterized protein n=1 Tax=Clonostachys chloroleuca TaxID=1926264 RepID=A0AA35PX87_9HYPO|nr:unnamed protein product [Clonostachys chloroleuca]